MSILKFEPNAPQSITLKFVSGKHVNGQFGEQVMYSLQNGSVMYVPVIVEKQLQELNAKPGEALLIEKQKLDGKVEWKVSRAVNARKPQAAATLLDGSESLDRPEDAPAIQTRLEFALKTALHAAKAAEQYSEQIGHPVRFDKDDVRLMAQTLVINERGRAA